MGLIASVIMDIARTNPRPDTTTNVVLGVFGALVSGGVTSFVCGLNITEFNTNSFVVAIIGTIVTIFLGRDLY